LSFLLIIIIFYYFSLFIGAYQSCLFGCFKGCVSAGHLLVCSRVTSSPISLCLCLRFVICFAVMTPESLHFSFNDGGFWILILLIELCWDSILIAAVNECCNEGICVVCWLFTCFFSLIAALHSPLQSLPSVISSHHIILISSAPQRLSIQMQCALVGPMHQTLYY